MKDSLIRYCRMANTQRTDRSIMSADKSGKKAISAIIATIMLLMITVALVSLLYAWSAGVFGSISEGARKQTDAAITRAGTELTIINARTASQSLAGYWKFDDNAETTATDSSGNGNTGTLTNDPAWVSGKYDYALQFDGSNMYVNIENANSLNPSSITISAWVYPSSVSNNGNIISKNDNFGYRFRVTSGKQAQFLDRGATNEVTATQEIPLNQWSHLIAVGNSNGLKIYINGILSESNTVAYGGPVTTGSLKIGSEPTFNEHFNGIIDEVRIYNRSLSAAEISSLYANNKDSIEVTIRNSGTQNIDLDTIVAFVDDEMAPTTASGTLAPGSVSTFTVSPSAVKCGSVLRISASYAPDAYYPINC